MWSEESEGFSKLDMFDLSPELELSHLMGSLPQANHFEWSFTTLPNMMEFKGFPEEPRQSGEIVALKQKLELQETLVGREQSMSRPEPKKSKSRKNSKEKLNGKAEMESPMESYVSHPLISELSEPAPKKRKKSQNLKKKYHYAAQRALKTLKLDKFLNPYKALVYKAEYFVVIMMIVQKFHSSLDKFKVEYEKELQERGTKRIIDDNNHKEHKFLIEDIERTREAIVAFENLGYQQATRVLFHNSQNNRLKEALESLSTKQFQIKALCGPNQI